jgi:mRNA interferase HigB
MRIITRKRLREWAVAHPDARTALRAWAAVTERAAWGTLMDVRRDFPAADGVVVASGNTVTVFNIRGNKYRLITAIHYRGGRVYLLRFLTHPEYDDDGWKGEL